MLLKPLTIKNLNLKNRLVMAPMCMYVSDDQGFVQPFHPIHYGTRAIGGVGLIIQEATAVHPAGRITGGDLGIWLDEHISGLKEIVKAIHDNGAYAGIQLNHAGRKARVAGAVAPSAIPYSPKHQTPREMTEADILATIKDFQKAALRANQAGYDMLELHAAHGYLLHEFLSPNTNHRTDAYGDRKKFFTDVVKAIREVWPMEKVFAVRFSGSEFVPNGVTDLWLAELINETKHLGIDLIDISSGGNMVEQEIDLYPGYQLPFAKTMKAITKLPTLGGGLIDNLHFANQALINEEADLIYLGRLLLREPYYIINHANRELNEDVPYPEPYLRGKK